MHSRVSSQSIAFADRFDLIAIHQAAARGTAGIPDLLCFLASPEPSTANAAVSGLQTLSPLASLPERWPASPATSAVDVRIPSWIAALGDRAASLDRFIAPALEVLRSLPADRTGLFLERLALFPGARRSVHAALVSSGLPVLARRLAKAAVELRNAQFPLQVTLSPTMKCQLRCDFCVAENESLDSVGALPRKDLDRLLDWMTGRGVMRLSLCGGEPTLYGEFLHLMEQLRLRSMESYIATNGLFPDASREALIAARPLCVSMHLAPEITGSLLDRFRQNARSLVAAGIYTVIRCNLPSPDTPFRRFLDEAAAAGISEVRTAVPMPNAYRANRFVDQAEFDRYRPLIAAFVAEARSRSIHVKLAKPVPLCMLDEATARVFLANGSYTTNCPVNQAGFTNNLVIYPDLTYAPCLGLNARVRRRITEFPSLRMAALQYRHAVAGLMQTPIFEHCSRCPLWPGGRCIGACLSYRPEPLAVFS